MSKKLKFFPGRKVQVHVNTFKAKRDKEGDRSVTIGFRVGLDNDIVKHAPAFVQEAYLGVSKKGQDAVSLRKQLENITTDFFLLEENDVADIRLARLKLEKIAVKETSNSEGDKSIVLTFQTDLPYDKALGEWLWKSYGTDLWATFDSAQATLLDIEDEPGGETVEEEEETAATA